MRNWFVVSTAALSLLVAAPLIGTAAPLAPGTSIPNDSIPALAAAGTRVADISGTYTGVGGGIAGTWREVVLSGDAANPYGGLDFLFQIHSTMGAVGHATMTGYALSLVDASAVAGTAQSPNNPSAPSPTTPWAPTSPSGVLNPTDPLPIARSGDGNVVSFHYDDAVFTTGTTSVVMIIRTNAPTTTTGFLNVIDGDVARVAVLAPSPEPTSLVLFAGSFLGLGAFAAWRRKRGQSHA